MRFLALVAALAITSPAFAVISFDQDVTNNAIFGSGNSNGGWTVDRASGVEIGLRAKVRYPAPANVFNSNGDGTYTHLSGAPLSNPDRANWNFEWSVNSNYDGSSSYSNIDSLAYLLQIDFDPGAGATDFLEFNPINPNEVIPGTFAADHSFGDNSTAQGAGAEATGVASYNALLTGSNLVQNSWNHAFFDAPFDPSTFDADAAAGSKLFNPNTNGEYTIRLTAFDGATVVASSSIVVAAIPEPTSFLFGSMIAGGVGFVAMRRPRRKVAADA